MNTLLRYLNKLDWILSGATVLAGLYLLDWLIVLAGVVGLVAAWYKPAERLKNRLQKRVLRKRGAPAGPTDQDLGEDLYHSTEPAVPASNEPARSFRDGYAPVQVRLSTSRHNLLKAEHFNLAEADDRAGPRWV